MKYSHPHSATRNMRPQLEHGGEYMQQNVNNHWICLCYLTKCGLPVQQDIGYVYATLGYAT